MQSAAFAPAVAVIIVAALGTIGSGARADIITFSAQLDGSQVGDCSTGSGSAATGSGTFVLDTETGHVDDEITYQGPESSEQAAHVHSAPPCEYLGGIVYMLPVGTPKIGYAVLDADQQVEMLVGLHFALVHTLDMPAGEIRGQILPDVDDRSFVRGDMNRDAAVDVADAIFGLGYLFMDTGPVACPDALDANDDGMVDFGDMVYLLTNLFSAGEALLAPYPECGVDPTDDAIACVLSACP